MPSLSHSLHGITRDLKGALLELRNKPGFSSVVILTLALCLGATTVLKPLPYPDPDQLVAVHNHFGQLEAARVPASVFDHFDLREQRELFHDIGLYCFLDLSRTGIEHAETVNAVAITSSLLRPGPTLWNPCGSAKAETTVIF